MSKHLGLPNASEPTDFFAEEAMWPPIWTVDAPPDVSARIFHQELHSWYNIRLEANPVFNGRRTETNPKRVPHGTSICAENGTARRILPKRLYIPKAWYSRSL
jgi:hypothetical protein